MSTRPTTDPAASTALSAAVDDVAQAVRYGSPRITAHGSYRPVTQAMFDRLVALTRELGYTPRQENISGMHGPGTTLQGQTAGWPQLTVTIDSGLGSTQAFSTFCHELAHILLGHNARTQQEVISQMFGPRKPAGGDPSEEAACELAAAAVLRAAGLGSGSSEAQFIAGKMGYTPVSATTKNAAKLAARVLWATVFENEPAYAAA